MTYIGFVQTKQCDRACRSAGPIRKEDDPMNTHRSALIFIGLATTLGAGCASSPPTPGQQMISQAKDTRELGRQWKSGNAMVTRGEKTKAEGRDMIAQGERKVQEGDRLIAEGNALKLESERLFQERFPGQTLDTSQ
jgi:hypothetical protein